MAENEIPEPPDWSDARTFFLEPDLWHEPYELDASESHHFVRRRALIRFLLKRLE